jgi:hypothetical protein
MLSLLLIIYVLLLILFNAVGDALQERGDKSAGKILHDAETLFWLAFPLIVIRTKMAPIEWWQVIAGYIFLRFTFFNPLHNWFKGMPLSYIGKVSWFDKLCNKFGAPDFGWWTARIISLLAGIGALLNAGGIYPNITF